MQRLITLLTVCVVALCGLTSCNLDKDYNFTYYNVATVQIENNDDNKAVTDYLKANYVEVKNKPTFFGKHYDAVKHFTEHFVEVYKTVDADFINDHLKAETDYVQLIGAIRYEAGDEWVGYYTWSAKDKRPAPAE